MYPGSDVEQETTSVDSFAENEDDEPVLRACDDVRTLEFSISGADGDKFPFVYEVTMILWLRSFLAQIGSGDDENLVDLSFNSDVTPLIRYSELFRVIAEDTNVSASAPFYMFHSHMDILLPLCLKSFLLRCASKLSDSVPSGRVILDDRHLQVLLPFVEMLTHALVGEALEGPDDDAESDLALLKALSTSQLVLDFLVGLSSVLHPEQVALLLHKHFKILRDFEIPDESAPFAWTKDTLRRARCSRQLRLRSVERLACMPNFVALNYPLKYSDGPRGLGRQHAASWSTQNVGYEANRNDILAICPYPDGRDRLPKSGWLAKLLTGESLMIASLSCEAVVAEAIAHVETSSPDSRGSRKGSNVSTSERPGASLKRDDLLMFQSVSIHAVTCVYELLLRRNAMDVRFQKDQARSRIAALFAPVILEKSLRSTRWLARMEATHKARSTWLLCFIYIMQEAPESQLRAIIRSYCFPPVSACAKTYARLHERC